MAFQPPPKLPDLDRLKAVLLTSGVQKSNNALYQVINQLLDYLRQTTNVLSEQIVNASNSGGGSGTQGIQGIQGPPGLDGYSENYEIPVPQISLFGLTRSYIAETISALWNFTLGIRERGRVTPLGEWLDVAYNAANFTASGTMTWTVIAANQVAYTYTLIGKTMTLNINVQNTNVTAPIHTSLQVAIPGGFTSAKQVANTLKIRDAGVNKGGYAIVVAGGSVVLCRNLNNASWTATASSDTDVIGSITFEVT